ncbi:hypothetical protein D9M68_480200 [compost metagenome]
MYVGDRRMTKVGGRPSRGAVQTAPASTDFFNRIDPMPTVTSAYETPCDSSVGFVGLKSSSGPLSTAVLLR